MGTSEIRTEITLKIQNHKARNIHWNTQLLIITPPPQAVDAIY